MPEKNDAIIDVLKGIQKELWGLRSVLNEANRFDHERAAGKDTADTALNRFMEHDGKGICSYLASIESSLSRMESVQADIHSMAESLKTVADVVKILSTRIKK